MLTLLQHIPRNKWYKLFCDNWYTGVDLFKTLHDQGIGCLGTVRANRLSKIKMTSDQVMRKNGRGSVELWTTFYDGVELRAIKWFDNRGVTLLSTYESVNPVSNVSRFDRKANKRVNVVCPSIVTTYNMFMGGVDLLDGFLSLHRISIRSKKWYHKLLFHFFDMVVVQSWILYRRQNEGNTLKLREFKMNVADCLIRKGKATTNKRGRPNSSNIEKEFMEKKKRSPTAPLTIKTIRLDGYHHWPVFMDDVKKGRCKNPECQHITRVYCERCNVNLCFTAKSNCFKYFHTD